MLSAGVGGKMSWPAIPRERMPLPLSTARSDTAVFRPQMNGTLMGSCRPTKALTRTVGRLRLTTSRATSRPQQPMMTR
eukprot:368668-Lingulodinium_polyedra.AAC.1